MGLWPVFLIYSTQLLLIAPAGPYLVFLPCHTTTQAPWPCTGSCFWATGIAPLAEGATHTEQMVTVEQKKAAMTEVSHHVYMVSNVVDIIWWHIIGTIQM